jgi:hypothetical protein
VGTISTGQTHVSIPSCDSATVYSAQLLLIILVAVCPFMLLKDGALLHGLLAGVAAAGVAAVSLTMRPGERRFFIAVIRRPAIVAAIPVVWLIVQLLPLRAIANTIWPTAAAALGRPLAGSITVDFGASVMALGFYLSAAAVAFLSTAVAIDRQRAVAVLFAVLGATVLIAVILLIQETAGDIDLGPLNTLPVRVQAVDCAAIGAIIAVAAGIRASERNDRPPRGSFTTFVVAFAAFIICAAAVVLGSSRAVMLATGFGVGAVVAVAAVRRLRLSGWALAAAVMLGVGTVTLLIANEPGLYTKGISLAFAAPLPPTLLSASQRALGDAPWTGTGAGTFAAIMPIYREINQPPMPTPPTAVAALLIELGWPMFVLIAAIIFAFIFVLLRASLVRGRDFFYPAAGAGCLISLLLLSFVNAGIFGTTTVIIAAAALGLALAQSQSRMN